MENKDKKPFWESKRFWGLLLALVGFVIMLYPCQRCFDIGKYISGLGLSIAFYGSAVANKKWSMKNK